jgi:hypothetical protein
MKRVYGVISVAWADVRWSSVNRLAPTEGTEAAGSSLAHSLNATKRFKYVTI